MRDRYPGIARPPVAPTVMCALILVSAAPIREVGPWAALWAAPAILVAAMVIAWGAESAQYFIAQGFALAILAWLQTLPEFAVEAILAWKRQTPLLMANLTGSLRLLTGFGWPMIYCTAALAHRHATGTPLRRIVLARFHSVEVVGVVAPIVYMGWVYAKASLGLVDSVVLIALYAGYLFVLTHVPPEQEDMEELESVPKAVVGLPRIPRIAAITALFVGGGLLIYFTAEPFLGSLLAISTALGVPSFIFIQWLAPFVSEFPEKVSAFYFALTIRGAPMALMNMVSSNINQWTLLAAMLPILFSISAGHVTTIPLDGQQRLELLMTLGQALVGALFLINMELSCWEASVLFGLFITQFSLSAVPPGPSAIGFLAGHIHRWVTVVYFVWAGVELIRLLVGQRKPAAFTGFASVWKTYVMRKGCPEDH